MDRHLSLDLEILFYRVAFYDFDYKTKKAIQEESFQGRVTATTSSIEASARTAYYIDCEEKKILSVFKVLLTNPILSTKKE